MRRSQSGIAIIRREQGGEKSWLVQWNSKWQGFHFIGGHVNPEEAYRDCVIREVGEELGISAPTDFQVSTDPLAQVSYTAWSRSAQENTLYTIELFEVQLEPDAEPRIAADSRNRWLRECDIRRGHCDDGATVSPTMQLLFGKVGI